MRYEAQSQPATFNRSRVTNCLFALILAFVLVSGTPATRAHASGATLRVKMGGVASGTCNDWGANACDLQYALGLAESTDEVWVKEGTYTPGTARTDTFTLESGVGIYGGFDGSETNRSGRTPSTHVTTLSGNIGDAGSATDNSYHVVYSVAADNSAVLDGFTVTGGYADGAEPNNGGGGMYIHFGGPTVSQVRFYENHALMGGGMLNNSGSPILTDVTFDYNTAVLGAGGMANLSTGYPDLTDVTFLSNSAGSGIGGGMYNYNTYPILTNMTFTSNSASSGGGIYSEQSSHVTMSHATFTTNQALGTAGNGGGMYDDHTTAILEDMTFYANTADGGGGGGMYIKNGSNTTITRGGFTSNAADEGGGIYNDNSDMVLTKVTFNQNTGTSNGGGLWTKFGNPSLTAVLFSSNVTNGDGGGIHSDSSSLILTKAALIDNMATSGKGGGIYSTGANSAALENVTFSGNAAMYGGGMTVDGGTDKTLNHVTMSGHSAWSGGGMYCLNSTRSIISNSIFWGNASGGDFANDGSCGFTINDSIVQGGCPNLGSGTCQNLSNTNPLLSPLADNGGFTETFALQSASPAIDSGGDYTACSPIDQRGVIRPQGLGCDIGAFEYIPAHIFADVPTAGKEWMEPWINAFYAYGITTGCGANPLTYCPENSTTRAAMAVFILRAIEGSTYTPPAAHGYFDDLPVTGKEWMEPWVDEFYDRGITTGCGTNPLRYCPENSVTRAAMAVFLLRALEGPSYVPDHTDHYFFDLPVAGKAWMEPFVDEFYERGITTGCATSPLRYCPENPVTRAAMAVFIGRAFDLLP